MLLIIIFNVTKTAFIFRTFDFQVYDSPDANEFKYVILILYFVSGLLKNMFLVLRNSVVFFTHETCFFKIFFLSGYTYINTK